MSTSHLQAQLHAYWMQAKRFIQAHPRLPIIIVIGAMLAYTFFAGEYTIVSFVKNYGRRIELKRAYESYRPRYEADSIHLSELKNNKELIERLAREHYYMHLPGEKIFVLRPDTASRAR